MSPKGCRESGLGGERTVGKPLGEPRARLWTRTRKEAGMIQPEEGLLSGEERSWGRSQSQEGQPPCVPSSLWGR